MMNIIYIVVGVFVGISVMVYFMGKTLSSEEFRIRDVFGIIFSPFILIVVIFSLIIDWIKENW